MQGARRAIATGASDEAARALSTALKEEVKFASGGVSSANFGDYNLIRMSEVPEIEVYAGALHGWCVPDSDVYNEAQAERAWSRMLDLFERRLS